MTPNDIIAAARERFENEGKSYYDDVYILRGVQTREEFRIGKHASETRETWSVVGACTEYRSGASETLCSGNSLESLYAQIKPRYQSPAEKARTEVTES